MWPPTSLQSPGHMLQDHHGETIQTILECIPKTCAVDYGWGRDAEEEHIEQTRRRITLQVTETR